MSNITRTFTRDELEALDLPDAWDNDDVKVISDEIMENSRWSIHHELIFQLKGQPADEAWRVWYSVGATESQDEAPWQDETEVTATLVRLVERVVKVWKPVKSPTPPAAS